MAEKRRRGARNTAGGADDASSAAHAGSGTSTTSIVAHISALKSAGDADAVVAAYEDLVAKYPLSGWAWSEYTSYLVAKKDERAKSVFERCLGAVPDVRVYESYLAHVSAKAGRDMAGAQTVQQAYEFALQRTQYDRRSGPLFQRLIQFLEQRPASTTWEQQHKMDEMRKLYRTVVALPVGNIEQLWRSYNAFENGISRSTARKFIDERSGAYMAARSCLRELEGLYAGAKSPELPQERTYDGADHAQLASWRSVLAYELGNPLHLDKDTHNERVLYTYWSALAACCYYPELWYDAVQWALANSTENAEPLALKALEVNPESFALCLCLASLYEETGRIDDAEAVYRRSIDALADPERRTLVYIELMQCTKRTRGVKQAREVSLECRTIPDCTYHIYTASAAIEYQNGDAKVAARIYGVAYRRFRADPRFIQCYLDFLYATQDMVNARVVFEKALNEIGPQHARGIYDQYLRYEASYADITALRQLEERYRSFYSVDLIDLARRRYQQSYSDPIGQELHLSSAAPQHVSVVPATVERVLSKLPSEYDGPMFNVSQVISLVQEVVR